MIGIVGQTMPTVQATSNSDVTLLNSMYRVRKTYYAGGHDLVADHTEKDGDAVFVVYRHPTKPYRNKLGRIIQKRYARVPLAEAQEGVV